ncbi:MAG: hypothetical protein KDD60_11745 [Bdellovibrionales bacterium]|nr:hypothetical protein [Bdellovibrionales bacterium]
MANHQAFRHSRSHGRSHGCTRSRIHSRIHSRIRNWGIVATIGFHTITSPALFASPKVKEEQHRAASGVSCEIVPYALNLAEGIRGLKAKKEIPCRVYNKKQVRDYIQATIEEKLPKHRLKMEEYVYKTLGLIPLQFNYSSGLIDLYLSQIGGFYEPEDEFFAMAQWMPSLLQMPIAVHELTHGIQDQFYALEKFLDPQTMSTDETLARSALVEGDATAVMLDYSRNLSGQSSIATEESVTAVMLQNVFGVGLSSGFSDAPESLKFLLIFPYTSGLRFSHALMRRGGYKAIDSAFRSPPQTSREILHPELYLTKKSERSDSKSLRKRLLDALEGETVAHEDSLGEFAIALVLRELGLGHQEAAQLASGWRGDAVVVYEAQPSQFAMEWRFEVDSEGTAKAVFKTMMEGFRKRYESPAASEFQLEGQTISLTQDGRIIVLTRM